MLENLGRRSFFGWLAGVGAATAVAASIADTQSVVEPSVDPVVSTLTPEPSLTEPVKVVSDYPVGNKSNWLTGSMVAACAHNVLNERCSFQSSYLDEYVPDENIRYASVDLLISDGDLSLGLNGRPGPLSIPSYPKGASSLCVYLQEQIKNHGSVGDYDSVRAMAAKCFDAPVDTGVWTNEDLDKCIASAYACTFKTVRQRIESAMVDINSELAAVSHNDIVCPKTHPPAGMEWSEQIRDAYVSVRVIRAYDIRGDMKITKIQVPYAYRRDTGERAWAESDQRKKEAHEAKLAAIRNRGNAEANAKADERIYGHFRNVRDNLVSKYGRAEFNAEPRWQRLDDFVNTFDKKSV